MDVDFGLLGPLLGALGIGALIGLQREQAGGGTPLAGVRTLPLVALLGALGQTFFPSWLGLGFLAIVVLSVAAYYAKVRLYADPGMTTSVATLLTFVFGAMMTSSDQARVFAIVFGTLTTAILALKPALHSFARRLTVEEVRAMLTFLVVALVVYPLLPDREISALLGLNPRFVWLMVVLISGIDLGAYVLVRALGRRGAVAAGAVGGLVSSTATTVSMSNRTKQTPDLFGIASAAIAVASFVMLGRILILVSLVHADLAPLLLPALAIVGIIMASAVWWILRRRPEGLADAAPIQNPFRLQPALVFGAFFALILLVTRWLSEHVGDLGILAAAIISGLIDVDAMTISLARLSAQEALGERVAAAGILLAVASNFAFKLGIVITLGTRPLARNAAPALVGGGVVCFVAAGLFLLY